MTPTKKMLSPAQLGALARGRAKAKANKEAAAKAVDLQYLPAPTMPVPEVKEAPQTPVQKGLEHGAARAKLKELGLAGQRLPGRNQTLVAAGVSITNVKGAFHFKAAPAAEKPEAKPVPALPPQARSMTIEEVIAALQFMTRHDLKI